MSPDLSAPRAPVIFSQTVEPYRAMVLDLRRCPVALGTVRARHTIGGSLYGYYVELDDGSRVTVAPCQLAEPENVIAPPPSIWQRAMPRPQGAA